MNQEEIEEYLTEMLEKSEREIDQVFAGRLKSLLDLLGKMHRKHGDGEAISQTEIYKLNRFEKEMERIKEQLHSDYTKLYQEINALMKAQYLQNYLRSGYVYEMTAMMDMGYQIPAAETVNQAILNPIKELTLSSLMNQHRNEIIRKIRVELGQGIQAGESYSQMATRLEDAVGFSRNKARRVARTESGRAQTNGRLASGEQAQQYANLEKTWMAELDTRTRTAHRKLDGQEANEDGNFEYRGMEAPGPSRWNIPSMDINCRCDIFYKVNGKTPDSRRARDYTDAKYQQRLADRMDELMNNEGLTEKQAQDKAKRQIYPPNKVVNWTTYEDWYDSLKKASG
ncbi:phage minor head protein [Salibacterium lacus]|uniref:Phage minor head protein n=1 Tax=Salibacterium lacus TaxID=1898109 RepID=A0ABW5SY60_9BACI